MRANYDNPIREHSYTIPDLVEEELDAVFKKASECLKQRKYQHIKRIILTGCGYSYGACLCIRDAVQELSACETLVIPAIELSGYFRLSEEECFSTLVVGISNSGMVTRVNEAMLCWSRMGAATLGLTANVDGGMKEVCDVVMDISIPSMEKSLPLRGCAMTMLALLGIGNVLNGGKREFREKLKKDMRTLKEKLPAIDQAVWNYIEKHSKISGMEFVGSGCERGAAFLGKIEMLGQAGELALDEDTEQWLHCNFFLENPEEIGTILFMSKNSNGAMRAEEALFYMEHLKRPVCVVTDNLAVKENSSRAVVYLPEMDFFNIGFFEMIVPSLIVGYRCALQRKIYSRGFQGVWELFRDGCGTTKSRSAILENKVKKERGDLGE